MGVVVLVVLVVLIIVLFAVGYRGLALLLLLGLLAFGWLGRRASATLVPGATVILPSDGGHCPYRQDGSGAVLH